MGMKKLHKDRLLKLANHLKTGKLGHKKFDFSVINVDPEKDDRGEEYKCGTLGCALGECPIVFPRQWGFKRYKYGGVDPVLKNPTDREYFGSQSFRDSEDFFGIDEEQSEHLFQPESQIPSEYGGRHLDENATRIQVANNILAFIKKMEKN